MCLTQFCSKKDTKSLLVKHVPLFDTSVSGRLTIYRGIEWSLRACEQSVHFCEHEHLKNFSCEKREFHKLQMASSEHFRKIQMASSEHLELLR